jgi:asparaginyl-tRNA synthetase
MVRTFIERLSEHIGEEVEIRGWLYNRRSKGKLQFLMIRDGSGIVQGVAFRGEIADEDFAAASSLTQESSVVVTGVVKEDSRAPGGVELGLTRVSPVQVAADYPIAPKSHGVGFLMDHRHLWLRSSRQWAISRVRDEIVRAIRDFMAAQDFVLVDAPIFTPNACEGTSSLFDTEYFGQRAYLSQSGQLYMEAACMALGKVYCFGPTFRAEKSKTRRHLTEFWMMEPEIAYATLDDVMNLAESMLRYVIDRVCTQRQRELDLLERDPAPLARVLEVQPFPRITYDEAFEILQAKGTETLFGSDLGGGDETVIASHFDRPVMVTHWPKAVKAFYMKPDPANPTRVLGVDILAPEGYGEIIGGGQRMEDLAQLEAAIDAHDLPQEAFEWFKDLRRYGSVPHGGFGMGLERLVAWICGLDHIREAIPFARMMQRLTP